MKITNKSKLKINKSNDDYPGVCIKLFDKVFQWNWNHNVAVFNKENDFPDIAYKILHRP